VKVGKQAQFEFEFYLDGEPFTRKARD